MSETLRLLRNAGRPRAKPESVRQAERRNAQLRQQVHRVCASLRAEGELLVCEDAD